VLQQASVIGRVFWVDAVVHLQQAAGDSTEMKERYRRVTEILNALQQKELVFKRDASAFAGTLEFIFKNTIFHSVVYESVLKRQRRHYHAQVARWLIERSSSRVAEHAGLIAEHFEQAEELPNAARWYGRAGKQARDTYAPEVAIAHYQRALMLMPGDDQVTGEEHRQWADRRILLYQGLGEVLWWRARYDQAMEAFRKMLTEAQIAENPEAQARAWNELAGAFDGYGDYRNEMESAEQAMRTAEAAGENGRKELARAIFNKGWALFRLGDSSAAQSLGQESLSLSRSLNARRSVADSLNLLGVVCEMLGQFEESNRLTYEALSIFQELGDKRGEVVLLNNLGETARTRGHFQKAIALYEEARKIAMEIGVRELELICLVNWCGAKVGAQDYRSAEAGLAEVMSLPEAVSISWLSDIYYFLAEAYLGQNKLDEALAAAQQAVFISRDQQEAAAIGAAWRTLGKVLARRNETVKLEIGPVNIGQRGLHALPLDAANCFAESWHVFDEIPMEVEAAHTLRVWGEFEKGQGNTARGEKMCHEALETLERLGIEPG
jgi:tetratricopeptide (TPR) repeat protein